MSKRVKAIIFDYGNVLCAPPLPSDVEAMVEVLGQPAEQFTAIYWRHRPPYDRAEMSAEEYWNLVAGEALDAERVAKLTDLDNRSWMRPKPATAGWVEAARQAGFRTALLSNLPLSLKVALENDSGWLPGFDVRTYSCTVGRTKPDREIYEQCVGELGVNAAECVFLDDRPENVLGAAEAGIHAVLFDTAERAARELAEQYGLAVNADQRSLR